MEGRESHSVGLASLPSELIHHITSFLPNCDIKSLRLTSSSVCKIVTLRIDRVFISANPRDIEVFHEVAKHEEFRKRVREVIWDETYFDWPLIRSTLLRMAWFEESCENEIGRLCRSQRNDCVIDRPGHAARMHQLAAAMSPEESFRLYQNLVQEQNRVLESRADVEAFDHALDRFPLLRRVTISAKTHGRLFMPLYETPMIRSFPRGFLYPLPKPVTHGYYCAYLRRRKPIPVCRRGVRSTLRALAKHGRHNVSEFVIEYAMEYSPRSLYGINTRAWTLADLHSLMQRPGFSRLDLHLSHPFSMHLIHETLEKVKNLKTLSLQVTGRIQHPGYGSLLSWGELWTHNDQLAKKNKYLEFPRSLAQSLQNLVIQGATVDAGSLVTALAPLASLRSLELRSVLFNQEQQVGAMVCVFHSQNARNFLYALRDDADWRRRPLQPKVTILLSDRRGEKGQMVKLDSEVNEFLYEDGENPFMCVAEVMETFHSHAFFHDGNLDKMCSGKGTKMDEFDPEYE